MSDWAERSAEEIREQANAKGPQSEKVVIGPVVFNEAVTVHGDLNISSS